MKRRIAITLWLVSLVIMLYFATVFIGTVWGALKPIDYGELKVPVGMVFALTFSYFAAGVVWFESNIIKKHQNRK